MMIKNILKFSFLVAALMLLQACGSQSKDDLVAFMAEVKAKPGGRIEPIPTFNPYKPFDYSSTSMRGPFDEPVAGIDFFANVKPVGTVAPDPNRPKEFLEQFSIESLNMVGTLEQDGTLFALLDDGKGNVHYVKKGNYIGKNDGLIVVATDTYIQVSEIVPSGSGWIERARTIELLEVGSQ